MNSDKQFWFLADVVERAENIDKSSINPNRRCLTWVNTLLINASSVSEAYDKAMKIAKKTYTVTYKAIAGNNVEWTVLGLSSLEPIDEELKDGNEIRWNDMGYLSIKHSNSLIKSKHQFTADISIKRRLGI